MTPDENPPRAVTRAPEAPPPSAEHHRADGGFRNPWPPHPETEARAGGFLRWRLDRLVRGVPPDPDPGEIPVGRPRPAGPRTPDGRPPEIRATWIGHSTFLLQMPGLDLLTDPVFSKRVSPVGWAGPARFRPPGLSLDALPPIDGVLLSHDHFDHLDKDSVTGLRDRFGDALTWYTPLGYRDWFARLGVHRVVELDWWQQVEVGTHRIVCLPIRHWTRRGWRTHTRLWSSWAVLPVGDAGATASAIAGADAAEGRGAGEGMAPRGVYFGADSGWFPGFREIGRRLGPFRMSLLPIGAYDPRWFMASSHIDPEEAVRAYVELGRTGAFVGMHWGTFRLTDEDPLEPPVRTRKAWRKEGLPEGDLHLPGIGGTVVV